MIAVDLYNRLYKDFNLANMEDDWSFMNFDNSFITSEFRTKYMGLVVDNTQTIQKVYTVTFPDKELIKEIFDRDETNILIFSHHAMGYIATNEGFPFYDIPLDYLSEMKKRKISFYMLHSPLDNYGKYSTSVRFAKALKLDIIEPFCQYSPNIQAGVICSTSFEYIQEIQQLVERSIGHQCKLYRYGEEKIKDGKVAIAAGGGSYPFVAAEIAQKEINCYITGFTRPLPHFEPTIDFHRIAKNHMINVIGATHYSTEKFACMAMVDYFLKLGLKAEFLEGKVFLEDL